MNLIGNINAIPFRGFRGRGGVSPIPPFPSISGMIARYSALGLTNEQMAENPVWKDLTGNGHDLQMKNFGWAGMSGVNGYVENFNDFRTGGIPVEQLIVDEQNSSLIKISVLVPGINNSIYIPKDRYQFGKSYYLRVSSEGYNEGDLSFLLYATAVSTATSIRIPLNPNGITEIPAVQEDDYQAAYITVGGKMGSLTIEQLPLYPGALVFDGADDCGTCDNFPILTKEKGYTVVALRQYLVDKSTAYLTANGDSISNTSFILEGNNYRDTWNFGKATTIQSSRILATQTSKQYDGVKLNIGTNTEGSNLLQVGKWSKSYSNVAIWELVFLDHDATEEELTKIKDYFVKTYPWLFPDQAWTVTGKTNEDTDRATIANITGNGNDLVLSNFGFAGNSGYGLYAYNFNSFELRNNVVKPTDVKKDSFRIVGTGNGGNVLVLSNTSNSANWKIRVTGMKEGDRLMVGNANKSGDYSIITKDGIYTFQKQYEARSINGVWYNSVQETDVLVEQIPEYEGYLVTDGVDDRIISSNFKFGENYTVVGEWKFLQEASNVSAGFMKNPNYWILYNYKDGINAYIKADAQGSLISGVRSIKASTSKGDIYPDFNSYVKIEPGKRIESQYALNIAVNSSIFTKLAFKNLAIYSEVLSKEDCIKAYNYLQTLKAK